MKHLLPTNLKSQTRALRARNGSSRNRYLPFLLLLTVLFAWQQRLLAQSTTLNTNFTNNNGSGTTTFNLQNTNPYDIIITEVGGVTGATGSQTAELYYKTTPVNGTPGAISAANGWTLAATGTFTGVANTTTSTTQPIITNMSFTIPAGATYGIAVSSASLRYSTLPAGPTTVAAGGVNLLTGDNIGYGGGTAPTAPTFTPRGFIGSLTFVPGTPCVAPPTAGQAVSSSPTVCPNTNFQLSLTGASGGQGMTYQWQSSANGTTGWTNVTGATTNNPTVTQTATTWYRAVLTCSGQTANSLPVQVTTSATPTSGTFTINKGAPASATNFQTITAAIASIQCGGVNGPIVFNIVAGSSTATAPYSEQVVIPTIPGASATNTITINGNGNTLVATPTTTNLGAITLDGADFVKIDNLNINIDAAATSGWGIQLKNSANNNIITNNTINLPLTSTSSSFNGIIAGTATATSGNNASNTMIQGNTINGGYYGINLNGNTNGADATNNQVINNQVKDPYFYGIYMNQQTGALVERNDISRPARANGGSLYGIYLTGTTTNTIVTKNRIHNTHDVATSLTGTVYGIYTSAAATVGAENIIKNNALYNFNNNGGTVYGLYNTGGNGTYYFHNTVVLDNANFTGTTLRGMYFLSASTNVKFQNNIVSVKANAGTRHAIYLGSTTIALTSNNNDLFAPGGNVGYYSTDRPTLADWKTANSNAYDQASVSADPIFVNPATGNLQPSSGALNNIGVAVVPPVTDDITGAPRGASPDLGAYEFVPAANDVGISNIITPNSGCGLTNLETVSVTISNYGTATQSNIPVSFTVNGGAAVNEVFAGPLAANASATYTFTAKANLSTPNAYTIVATTNLTGDALPVNNSFTKVVNSIPVVNTFPYFQNFENGAGGWTAGGTNSSWALGTPAKTNINSAGSGTNSWVTGLTANYNASENSRVLGPCFNFSTLTAPVIEMKVWWYSEGGWDGAVLQSSIDGGTTWQNVGAYQDPNNWYNDNSLDGRAGGQDIGWAGTTTASSGGWVTAKHNLTGLGGQSAVLLRIAFGSDASVFYDGFAFDDVSIYQTPSNDVELVAITAPIASGCGFTNAETVTVTIKNNGTVPTPSFPVKYQIGTNAAVTENVTTPIAAGATATFNFATKANFSVVGTYTLTATTMLAGDGLPANDSKSKTITVVPTISTLPYTEGFENGNGGWIASGTNSSWAIGTPAKAVINSAGGGTKSYVTNLTGTYNGGEISQVVGPCFNFAGKPDPDFEMKAWWNSEGGWDGAVLQSSINGGTTWQNVGNLGDPNNWYNDNSLDGRAGGQDIGWAGTGTASSGGWVRVKHKLTGLGGQSSVLLRIAFGADGSVNYDGFAFDDIRIGDNTNNLAINSFVPLTQLCGFGTNEKVEVVLENLGSIPVSGYTVSYTVNNGTSTTSPVSAPGPTLQPGVPTNFVFPVGANLSAAANYTIVVTVNNANDPELANNTITYTIGNASYSNIPPIFNFETAATGVAGLRTVTKAKSGVSEGTAASLPLAGQPATSTKGMIMEGVTNTSWVMPVGLTDPWTNNPDHFSGAYICFDPQAAANPGAPLWLSFDLKQLYKTANANTNFRVTVNGTQVGPTYRPPFAGTPIDWQKIYVDLTPYKNSNIQIGLESSVAEPFANGAGTANLIDNIRILRSNPTGINNQEFQSSINVYPNPSNGEFSVSVPTAKAYTLEVTDLTGRVVKKEVIRDSNLAKLDLKGQAQGVYMLKITSDGASAVHKLIVE